MFKSKSFNLYNEETSKQPKQLYQPRRIRWLKFILLPVATSFVIFLVVYNIDFSNDSVQTNSTSNLTFIDKTDVIYFKQIDSTKSKLLLKCDCPQYSHDYEFLEEKIPEDAITELGFNMLSLDNCTVYDTPIKKDIKIKLLDKIWQCSMTNIISPAASHIRKLRNAVYQDNFNSSEAIDPSDSTTTVPPATTPKQTARTKVSTKTTPSISINNSTLSTNMICVNPAKEVLSNKSVSYNGHIRIVDHASTSLQIVLSQVDLEFWRLVYFSNYSVISYVEMNETDESLDNTNIELNYLSCSTAFVFCLISDENKTSPFNCLSHQSIDCEDDEEDEEVESWFTAHSSLVIGIAIGGILCCVIFGSLAMYCVLRLRPTWLRGSKQLVRLARDSDTMYLFPKNELYAPTK